MPTPESYRLWAKDVCIEVFRENGVSLSEDDSVILIATVFKRALELWRVEDDAVFTARRTSLLGLGDTVGENVRSIVSAEFGAQASKLRKELLADAESASTRAEQAVRKALSIPGRNEWRYRVEGAFAGAGLMLSGAWLFHWLTGQR